MKILVSKYAGFCGGVKAAVLMLERALRQYPGRPIKVFGQLVHNKDVNCSFEERGVQFITSKEEAKSGDLVFIRAHGTPAETYEYLRNKGIEYVDATCYKVKNTQEMIMKLEQDAWQIAVFGEEEHPETIGLVGHTSDGFIINKKLLKDHPPLKHKVALLTQSTANREEFQEVAQYLKENCEELSVHHTFCDFTVDSQGDARSIRDQSDLMLVIGGKNSSNTSRLQEICSEIIPSYHIQRADHIQEEWLKGKEVVGITAGASTPEMIIDAVVSFLETQGGVREDVIL